VHGELIQQILESLKLPEEISIVHVPGHQNRINFEAWGNSFTDETAKRAVLTLRSQSSVLSRTFLLFLLPIFTLPRKNN
jgi:hypothetical protein